MTVERRQKICLIIWYKIRVKIKERYERKNRWSGWGSISGQWCTSSTGPENRSERNSKSVKIDELFYHVNLHGNYGVWTSGECTRGRDFNQETRSKS